MISREEPSFEKYLSDIEKVEVDKKDKPKYFGHPKVKKNDRQFNQKEKMSRFSDRSINVSDTYAAASVRNILNKGILPLDPNAVRSTTDWDLL